MTAKIETFKSQADFDALGKRIEQAADNGYKLAQTGLIAAFDHLAKNGNVNVLKPILNAIDNSFRNRGMVNKAKRYVLQFTWLEYNPKNLTGAKLVATPFDALWVKNKNKKMDVDGARKLNFWDIKTPTRAKKKVKAHDEIQRMFKRLQSLINERLLWAGNSTASLAQIKAEVNAALGNLTVPRSPVVTAKKTATPKRGAKSVSTTEEPARKAA